MYITWLGLYSIKLISCQNKFDMSRTFDVSYKDEILKALRNMRVDVFHIRPSTSLFIILANIQTKENYNSTGCFFQWPPKKCKYGKARLGESKLT